MSFIEDAPEQKTQMLTQDMFPGAWLEPQWSRSDSMRYAPYYTIMLACGAKVLKHPNGNTSFVSLSFEGKEYVLHNQNYETVKQLYKIFQHSYCIPRGYDSSTPGLRFNPGFIIDGLKHLMLYATELLDIPVEKTRMIWMRPDEGPCGEYRSTKPFAYMNTFFKDKFYPEHCSVFNMAALPWYDVVIMHRILPKQLLGIFQQLKTQENKVLVMEYDDDFFNVPSWNYLSNKIGKDELDRFHIASEIADVIVCSTQELVNQSNYPEKTMHGPNLVNTFEFSGQLNCCRELLKQYAGYHPSGNCFKNSIGGVLNTIQEDFQAIRILWAGSNTHDGDLKQIVGPILNIGKKYGIAVNFVFFGYLPTEFAAVEAERGNTKGRLVVKNEYSHFIHYISAVKYNQYIAALRSIDPDFALCPLAKHPFNLSKSNLRLLEMGALGVPCIATDYGEYSYGNYGVKIKAESNQKDWEFAIEDLINNVEKRQELGNAWHEEVLQNYSWNNVSENRNKWDAIFDRIHNITTEVKAKYQEKIDDKS